MLQRSWICTKQAIDVVVEIWEWEIKEVKGDAKPLDNLGQGNATSAMPELHCAMR